MTGRDGAPALTPVSSRVGSVDWDAVRGELDQIGCALLPGQLVTPGEAAQLIALYDRPEAFRSTVDMGRYRFGSGEYRYLKRPLPPLVEDLRQVLYPRLLPIARQWHARLGRPDPWPDDFDEWIGQCHAAGQTEPTPLILSYEEGDWNALHRDLYGDMVFPLQVVINLTTPGGDYAGGEFLLVEQRPRAQSRGTAVTLPFGQGLVFTTRDRPLRTARGWSAAPVRHGVSVLRWGRRFTLGLLFHDAT